MTTETQRKVLTNRYLKKTFKEIGKLCNTTPGNAYNIFNQTIIMLQNNIKKGEEAKKLLDCMNFSYVDNTDYMVWKYPMRIDIPHLIFSESVVDTATKLFGDRYKIFTFKNLPTYGRRLRIEDLIVHTLKFDHTAAKAISERNRDFIDKDYLEQRIKTESMEKDAMMISLDIDYGFNLTATNVLRYKAFILNNNPSPARSVAL